MKYLKGEANVYTYNKTVVITVYECPFCEQKFKSDAEMTDHAVKTHPSEVANLSSAYKEAISKFGADNVTAKIGPIGAEGPPTPSGYTLYKRETVEIKPIITQETQEIQQAS